MANTKFKTGQIPWNKGLTKEIDERISTVGRPKTVFPHPCIYCGKSTRNNFFCSIKCRDLDPNFKQQKSILHKKLWESKEYRIMQVNAHIGKKPDWKNPEQRRENISKGTKESWKNAKDRKLIQGEQTSKRNLELWKNEKYVQKQMKARKLRPNGGESFLLKILERYFPGCWKYVGDGSLIIGGKCPDYVNKANSKLIEFFGVYWHKLEEEELRKQYFKKYGYETLVIWSNEIQLGNLVKRLGEFTNGT